MDNKDIQAQIDEINRKLDVVIEEIGYQRRQRQSLDDLREDLTRVGTDVYHSALGELEEFTYSFDMADVMLLSKQLLRNVNNLKTAFEQMESARDFVADFTMISKGAFNDVLLKLDDLDKKGYFRLLTETEQLLDAVVSSVTVEDLQRLRETIPILASVMNRLADPDMVKKLDTAVAAFENYSFDEKSTSFFSLLKTLSSTETRKGMAYSLGLMKQTVTALEQGGI